MSKLEVRLEKLERALGATGDARVGVIFVTFVPAHDGHKDGEELYGYCGGGIETIRRLGESDDDLINRAMAAATPVGGIVPLYELRR